MLVILQFVRGIDTANRFDRLGLALILHHHHESLSGLETAGDSGDIECLEAGEAEARDILAREELERKNSHAHEIAPMNPFVALRDNRLDSKQSRSFRGPISRRTGTVFLAGED